MLDSSKIGFSLPVALIFTRWSLFRVHYKMPGATVGQPISHCPQTGSERLTGAAFLEMGGKKGLCDEWHKLTGILLGINYLYLSSWKYCVYPPFCLPPLTIPQARPLRS